MDSKWKSGGGRNAGKVPQAAPQGENSATGHGVLSIGHGSWVMEAGDRPPCAHIEEDQRAVSSCSEATNRRCDDDGVNTDHNNIIP